MKTTIRIFSVLACLFFWQAVKADEGMWMINAIDKALEKKMQERGLKLSAREIYDADAEGAVLSDAVVSLEFGCTGSIISDQGLMITNHHCAYSDVHALSTDEKNYLEDGFWAISSSDEVPIKGKKVYFLKKVLDVTDEVVSELEKAEKEGRMLGSRKLSFLMEKKYKAETGYEAWFSSMWKGSRYYIALYEVYSDVRLVAAPPVSVAAFGGDIDNWEWPQHKCDFALYRIYTSKDGKPSEYSPLNVPMVPEKKLEISLAGYKPGDFTMVIGFPGMTDRYSSSYEVESRVSNTLPISNKVRGDQMAIMREWMNRDPSVRLKYADSYFSLSNVQELNEGEVLCCRRFGVAEAKRKSEEKLQVWIDSDPARKEKWGNLLSLASEKYEALGSLERNVTYYRETLIRGTRFSRIVPKINILKSDVLKKNGIRPHRVIDAGGPCREEVDCCRKFRFRGGRYNSIRYGMMKEYESMVPEVERDLLTYAVRTYFENVDSIWLGPYQKALKKHYTGGDGKCDYAALTDSLWKGSFLTSIEKLEKFASEDHSVDEYLADPMCRFFQDISIRDFNDARARIEGEPDILELNREYTHAIYQKSLQDGMAQYPDANSTIRISYGTVGDIEPYDGVVCSWRSTSAGILEKYDSSTYEFGLRKDWKKLLEQGDWGKWWPESSAIAVDFLTDNDITGGNSGSPVLDAEGRLIGLAFDGNKESLASNTYYTPGYNKCVCTDIRFVLFTLDKYAGMSRIIKELGL